MFDQCLPSSEWNLCYLYFVVSLLRVVVTLSRCPCSSLRRKCVAVKRMNVQLKQSICCEFVLFYNLFLTVITVQLCKLLLWS